MSVLSRLRDQLFKAPEFDESRRRVIQGAGALAALAVVASVPGGYSALTENGLTDLQTQLASGLVENQTFYLSEPVVLRDMKGLIIRNCTFVLDIPEDKAALYFEGTNEGCCITNCTFEMVRAV